MELVHPLIMRHAHYLSIPHILTQVQLILLWLISKIVWLTYGIIIMNYCFVKTRLRFWPYLQHKQID